MIPKWNYCELYYQNYYFFVGYPEEIFNEYLKKEHSYVRETKDSNGACMLIDSHILIWTKKVEDLGALVHECVHAAHFTLSYRGIDIRDSDAEAMAYLTDYIFRKARACQ